MFARRHRRSFGLNTTSTADISFVLLIFFLVTTSMDQSKGLVRQLPPMEPAEQTPTEVDRRDVLTFALAANGTVTVDGKPMADKDVAARVEQHVTSRGQRHIIAIDIDPDAEYQSYFHLQNSIVEAYRQLRDAEARRRYGRPMKGCTADERDQVRQACPQRIVENYMEKGGNRP